MNSPGLLLVLLALPFVTGAVIVAVSVARRRRAEAEGEPVHRLQADSAVVQDAEVYPTSGGQRIVSGRERRAAVQGSDDER